MSKFYRVIKDTPAWSKGAILKQMEPENSDDKNPNYCAISDLWDTFEKGYPNSYQELAGIVENSLDYFERVYPVSHLKKTIYLTREAARKAHDELYEEK